MGNVTVGLSSFFYIVCCVVVRIITFIKQLIFHSKPVMGFSETVAANGWAGIPLACQNRVGRLTVHSYYIWFVKLHLGTVLC